MRPLLAALVVGASATLAAPALATPMVNAGLTTGPALTDLRTGGPRVASHLGVRGDVLFFRDRDREMALGPYVDVMTVAFDTLEPGGGLSWLIPLGDPVLTVSGGGHARWSALGLEPGVSGGVFLGGRVHNFHSVYNLTVGGFAQTRYALGDSRAWEVLVGAQLDLVYLAIPFIYAYEAARR